MQRRAFFRLSLAGLMVGLLPGRPLSALAPLPIGLPIIGQPCEGCDLVFAGQPARLSHRTRIAPEGETGEPMRLSGRILDVQGRPARGIVIYAYHADARGIYPDGDTRHGRLRAWVVSDSDGRYTFDSIRPGAYPGRSDPAHVHMHIIEPGRFSYYIDNLWFDDDPRITAAWRRQPRPARGGDGLVQAIRDGSGVWQLHRDIHLGLHIPDYRLADVAPLGFA